MRSGVCKMKNRKCRKCKEQKTIEEFTRVNKGDNKVHVSITCNQCYNDLMETLVAIRMYSEGNK